jgi:hypothetical protein
MFINPQLIEKLFFLHFHIEQINKLIFLIGLFAGDLLSGVNEILKLFIVR